MPLNFFTGVFGRCHFLTFTAPVHVVPANLSHWSTCNILDTVSQKTLEYQYTAVVNGKVLFSFAFARFAYRSVPRVSSVV
jgi:hypothetical protein